MERRIFVTGIIAAFIVLEAASAGANTMSTETQNNSGVISFLGEKAVITL